MQVASHSRSLSLNDTTAVTTGNSRAATKYTSSSSADSSDTSGIMYGVIRLPPSHIWQLFAGLPCSSTPTAFSPPHRSQIPTERPFHTAALLGLHTRQLCSRL